ncbi:Os02g0519801 [Oryza sativa Japonica Group]|uniref:Os02g0519801 protein n=1 Tax=Oryza sativa subsp. japonica TaxID=39947 RepID=A0A0P0VJN5_ORYSJ|nr:Os02g0519801 [Oryza sativa Japonica Group]
MVWQEGESASDSGRMRPRISRSKLGIEIQGESRSRAARPGRGCPGVRPRQDRRMLQPPARRCHKPSPSPAAGGSPSQQSHAANRRRLCPLPLVRSGKSTWKWMVYDPEK